jgi:hypothetical protein
MTFWRTARNAAADQYGRKNFERYARRAKVARWTIAIGSIILALLIVAAAKGGLGG